MVRKSQLVSFFSLLALSGVVAAAFTETEVPLSSPRFAEVSYSIGFLYNPKAMVLADFTGDGNPDMAVFDDANGQIFLEAVTAEGLLAQNGNEILTKSDARDIAAGDFDGDGQADLVAANGTDNSVSVYMKVPGSGWTGFRDGVTYHVGSTPVSVAVADVDGDGKADIVTANAGDDTVSVLLGNGDGTFGAAHSFKVASAPSRVALADLDGDGNEDIIAIAGGDSISVLMGKGDGSFGAHREYSTGAGPAALAIGDLTGDGVPDVVVANTTDGDVSLLEGTGHGGFVAQAPLATAANPISVSLADFTGGGMHSVVTASSDGTVSVLSGDGKGSFGSHVDYFMGNPVATMAVADFNADGLSDVAVASIGGMSFNGNKTSIAYANDDGTLQAGKSQSLPDSAIGLASGDLDGDGNPDVVVGVPNLSQAQVWLGDGHGGFTHKTDLPITSTILFSLAVADVNHDRIPDVVVGGGSGQVWVFIGNGDGTFTASSQNPLATGSTPDKVLITDLNGDSFPDILTGNQSPGTGISVLLGNGDGTFQAHQDSATPGNVLGLAVGDLDGDGKPDVVATDGSAALFSVLKGNGDGTFQPHVDYAAHGQTYGIAIGDLDEDGKPDVVAANSGFNVYGVYRGNGDGTFQAPKYYQNNNGAGPSQLLMQDVDGDGHLDIVCSVYASDFVDILYGAGDGTFVREANAATGGFPGELSLADFNRDGTLDIAVAEENGKSFRIIPAIYTPPVAQSGSVQVEQEKTYAGQVKATAPSGDTPSYGVLTGPKHGTFSMGTDGSYSYVPAKGYLGSDSFTYQAKAHMRSGKATITLNVVQPGAGQGGSGGGGGGDLSLLMLGLLGFAALRRKI